MTAKREKVNNQGTLGAFSGSAFPVVSRVVGRVPYKIWDRDGSEVAPAGIGMVGTYSRSLGDAEQERAEMLARVNEPEVYWGFIRATHGRRKVKRVTRKTPRYLLKVFLDWTFFEIRRLYGEIKYICPEKSPVFNERLEGVPSHIFDFLCKVEEIRAGNTKAFENSLLENTHYARLILYAFIVALDDMGLVELLRLVFRVLCQNRQSAFLQMSATLEKREQAYRAHIQKRAKPAPRRNRIPRPPDLLPCPPSAPLAPPA